MRKAIGSIGGIAPALRGGAISVIVLGLLGACSGSTPEPTGQSGQPGFGVAPPVATAGSAAPAPTTTTPPATTPPATTPPATTPPTTTPPVTPPSTDPPPTIDPNMPGEPTLALDECDLDTQWLGDEYCVDPPPADQGFQLRVGPTNYDSPGSQYLVNPGEELNEVIPATSGNTESVYYYWRQYRMRPGSHHMILSKGGGIAGGGRMGGSQTPAKDSPTGGVIAEENQGVGMQLAARTPLSFSLHYYNFSDAPIIKDVWVNVWYRDAADVTEPASEVFSMLPINIAPGRHVVLSGDCPVNGTGRLLTLYGHRHANNLRFSAWRERGGMRELVFEDYDWEEPTVLEYSSVITNLPPNPAAKVAGGYSGVLDVRSGDNIHFECEITNMTNNTFRGANEAIDDEMCILVGDSAGATLSPLCASQTVDVN
jgi:hypothetical protein